MVSELEIPKLKVMLLGFFLGWVSAKYFTRKSIKSFDLFNFKFKLKSRN